MGGYPSPRAGHRNTAAFAPLACARRQSRGACLTIATCASQSPSLARNTATPPLMLAGGLGGVAGVRGWSFARVRSLEDPFLDPPCALGSSLMSFFADSVNGRTRIGEPMSSAMPSSSASASSHMSTDPASLPSHGSAPSTPPRGSPAPAGSRPRPASSSSSSSSSSSAMSGVGSGSSMVSPGFAGATMSRTCILPPTRDATPSEDDLNVDGR